MLGTVLDRLANLFTTPQFLVGSFFPVLAFAYVNHWLASLLYPSVLVVGLFHGGDPGAHVVESLVVLMGMVLVAVILHSLGPFLRALLEGRFWPSWRWIQEYARGGEEARYLESHDDFHRIRVQRREVQLGKDGAPDAVPPQPGWPARLRAKRKDGNGQQAPYDDTATAAKAIQALRRLGSTPSAKELEAAVTVLEAALAATDAGANAALDQDHVALLGLIDDASVAMDSEYTRVYVALRRRFGDKPLAPTALGNLARALEQYASVRYSLSLDTFGAGLERLMQADSNYHAVLQDAKTQLSLFVSFYWLTVLTIALWLPLSIERWRGPAILCVGLGGPLLAYTWYLLAIKAYDSFGRLFRSGVDMFRFGLLGDLHGELPTTLVDERKTWETLQRLCGYGEDVNIRYDHSKP